MDECCFNELHVFHPQPALPWPYKATRASPKPLSPHRSSSGGSSSRRRKRTICESAHKDLNLETLTDADSDAEREATPIETKPRCRRTQHWWRKKKKKSSRHGQESWNLQLQRLMVSVQGRFSLELGSVGDSNGYSCHVLATTEQDR